jgi:hypothetical protein
MFDDETSRARRPRWIIGLVVAAALALGAMTAVALGQTDTTPTDTQTTTTETTPGEPTIPEGFDEEDCEITEQPDGSTQVTCQREESQTETSETSTAAGTAETATDETTTEVVVPVGGTGAGLGGTDGDDGSAMPILIGIGGLLMAFAAAALARRRHFG